jgi:endonuclease III
MTGTGGARRTLERCLWHRLQERMDQWNPAWRDQVGGPAAEKSLARRRNGDPFSDDEIFEGLLLAVLSGNTRWSTVERIQAELTGPFEDFSLPAYADKTDVEVTALVPWFSERKAGSTGLKAGLIRLRDTAALLDRHSRDHGSADTYFLDALREAGGEPEDLAVALGSSKRWKLPGFGIALAAEALRNIGFDLCKPDRHVLRCIAAWGLVEFANWPQASDFTAPKATPAELRQAMYAVREIAEANGAGVSYATSMIWTAGALSGARLTNNELAGIRTACSPQH